MKTFFLEITLKGDAANYVVTAIQKIAEGKPLTGVELKAIKKLNAEIQA